MIIKSKQIYYMWEGIFKKSDQEKQYDTVQVYYLKIYKVGDKV